MINLLGAPAPASLLLQPFNAESLKTYRGQASAAVNNQINNQQFKAQFARTALITNGEGLLVEILVGTDRPPEDPRATQILFARLAETLPPGNYTLDPADWPGYSLEHALLGWGLASYEFTTYLKQESREWAKLFIEGVDLGRVDRLLLATFLARDLVNTPAADLGPAELCNCARELAGLHGAEIAIIEGDALEKEYPAVHAVGKASVRPGAVIDLRWGKTEHPRLTLVGKGVVFDTGGLDLKPSAGMLIMKKDMGGAAVALALTRLVLEHKLPVRLRLLIPAVENAVSGIAFRPGDVLRTRKGLTVEVGNTDAEGRLILCDALAEAVTEQPDLLIDMATLTGACRIALGQDLPAYFTPNDQLALGLETASQRAADPLWRMPLWRPYLSKLKSTISDLNNSASTPFAGAVTAALFLHEFVKPFQNWIHLDMYAWRNDALPGYPKGGEASALRALFHFLEDRYSGEGPG